MEKANHTVIVSVRIREYLGDELLSAPSGFVLNGFVTRRWRFILLLSLFTAILIVVVTCFFVK